MSSSTWNPEKTEELCSWCRGGRPGRRLREHNGGLADGGTSRVKPGAEKEALFCWNPIHTWRGLGIPPCPTEELPVSRRSDRRLQTKLSKFLFWKKTNQGEHFPLKLFYFSCLTFLVQYKQCFQTVESSTFHRSRSLSNRCWHRCSGLVPAEELKGPDAKKKVRKNPPADSGFILPAARPRLWKVPPRRSAFAH